MSKLVVGVNDLKTWCEQNGRMEILLEWDYEKNAALPSNFVSGSTKKAWWICSLGHSWQTTIEQRKKGGCPYCSNHRVLFGYNDLMTKNPQLAADWNYEKNKGLLDKRGIDISTPDKVTEFSGQKVWWMCSKGHEWESTVSNRSLGNGCPYCSNKKVLTGYNDLATTNPELAIEWNYEKNGDLKPTDVTFGCDQKVWWKCLYGHEWKASPNNRTNQGVGCSRCSGKGSSLPEQGVAFYMESICKVERRNKVFGKEIDIYLPDYKIGIEYDGRFFHQKSTLVKENEKDNYLKNKGINIIRIKESDRNSLENNHIHYDFDNMHSNYEWAIKQLCSLLGELTGNTKFQTIDIDVQRDMARIRERISLYHKENSISSLFPDLAKEWNYEKNGILQPDMVYANSNKSVWWKCKCGHEWRAKPNNRVHGKGCPYCAGQKIAIGFNDLATKYPDLAKEWNYEKNAGLVNGYGEDISTPYKVTAVSGQKVWWKCSQGHEWKYTISDRVKGDGCPYCSGRRADKGKTDLATLFPKFANEWHPTNNGDLKPTDIRPNYAKRVWWRCSLGHEWQTSPNSRVNGNTGCPFCFRLKVGKRVKNIETGEIFDNQKMAAKTYGIKNSSTISACCLGKRNTAGGFHWEYVDESFK